MGFCLQVGVVQCGLVWDFCVQYQVVVVVEVGYYYVWVEFVDGGEWVVGYFYVDEQLGWQCFGFFGCLVQFVGWGILFKLDYEFGFDCVKVVDEYWNVYCFIGSILELM